MTIDEQDPVSRGNDAPMTSDADRGASDAGYLLFRLADRRFVLPAAVVQEILPMLPLMDAAAAPSFIQGYLDLGPNEEILPVLRLDRLLQLALPPDTRLPGLHTPIIVVRAPDGRSFGLLAERVDWLFRASADAVKAAGETFNGCVCGLLTISEGTTAALLSIENLLLTEERERLAAFTAMAEARRRALAQSNAS